MTYMFFFFWFAVNLSHVAIILENNVTFVLIALYECVYRGIGISIRIWYCLCSFLIKLNWFIDVEQQQKMVNSVSKN